MCSYLGSLLRATLQPPGATDTSPTFACLSPAQTSALRSKVAAPGASPDSQTRGAPLLPSGVHAETWEGTLMGVEELGAGRGSCSPTAVLGPRPNLWTGKTALSPRCPVPGADGAWKVRNQPQLAAPHHTSRGSFPPTVWAQTRAPVSETCRQEPSEGISCSLGPGPPQGCQLGYFF